MGIEARGIGILRAPMKDNARLGLIVDLGQKETERLPEQRTAKIMGHDIPVFYDYKLDAFAQSLYIFARYGVVKDL
jgi:HPr kinase/phosphorylase